MSNDIRWTQFFQVRVKSKLELSYRYLRRNAGTDYVTRKADP